MNQVFKIIFAALAVCIVMDAAQNIMKFTLKPSTFEMSNANMVQSLTDKLILLPAQIVGFVFMLVAKVVEATVKTVFGFIGISPNFSINTEDFKIS